MKESKNWFAFCTNPKEIEGYEKAVNDTSNTVYCCHHRLETHTLEGELRETPLSREELKKQGIYYHRPANELIILTRRDHVQLHRKAEGKKNWPEGTPFSTIVFASQNGTKERREKHLQRMSNANRRRALSNPEWKKEEKLRLTAYNWGKANNWNDDKIPETWDKDQKDKYFYVKAHRRGTRKASKDIESLLEE